MCSRVYVGRIPRETRQRDLKRFFRDFGQIQDVLIKPGYGFVQFYDHRDAEDAVCKLHGKRLLGMRVDVEIARGIIRGRPEGMSDRRHRSRRGPSVRTNYRVFVENLSTDVCWQDLKDYLRLAGEVTFADAHKRYRNTGIVEFATYEGMKNAIRQLDDTILKGSRIRLFEDENAKKLRSKSRSRSKSKSRSRSRSRNRSQNRSRGGIKRMSADIKSSSSHSRSRSSSRKGEESPDHSRERSIESRCESADAEDSEYKKKSRSRSNSNSVRWSSSRSTSMSFSGESLEKTPDSSIEPSPNGIHP
ncbi:serine-arginine protein 55-like [Rhynchophorus ferrugineus]|uniref:serine-arginine protein 55-like n=1 Tax=Rhynchophorus ferrugineus TaxID=354439 RepID=UPI003FCD490A